MSGLEDILALVMLDALHDRIEQRFGKLTAWIVTFVLAVAILGVAVWLIIFLASPR